MKRKTSAILLKTVVYGSVSTIVLLSLIRMMLRNDYPGMQVKPKGTYCSPLDRCNSERRDMHDLLKFGLSADYFRSDFIADNHLVDKMLPLLKTNTRVIEETQRIQTKMLKVLIGKYKYAMLFDFADFENKGDPAITVGEVAIIRKLGLELIFSCATKCEKETIENATNLSKQYSTKEMVVLLHGGGNLLAYISHDLVRKLVLEKFPDFEVIMFPQSIWHNASVEETRLFQDAYSKHQHLTFLYRDRNSYNLGKTIFPRVKCYLMPDMAFQIGAIHRSMEPTHDILWLRRTDFESMKYKLPDSTHDHDVIIDDWRKWKTPKGSTRLENSFLIAANGMLFLQRGRVVITDRLHGHILCVLLNIPHVVFDPKNNKITSYMQSWTRGIENILVAYSPEDALKKAIELLRKLDDQIPKKAIISKDLKHNNIDLSPPKTYY